VNSERERERERDIENDTKFCNFKLFILLPGVFIATGLLSFWLWADFPLAFIFFYCEKTFINFYINMFGF
jgi:hypothetical protein